MGFRLICTVFAGLLFGCMSDRHSGTEVGNPEVTVSARFGLVGEDSPAVISSMEMMVMKMEYRMPDDSPGSLWDYPAGMGVDLAAPGSAANLPSVKVASPRLASADLMLSAGHGDSTLPDSVSFSGFSNPRFIKIRKKMDADSMRFLFELPEGMHMKLSFDSDRLETWQTGNTLSMEILFDGARWTSAITDQPYRIRSDSEGKPYVLIGPGENTELHDALKTLFPECFVADGAEFL